MPNSNTGRRGPAKSSGGQLSHGSSTQLASELEWPIVLHPARIHPTLALSLLAQLTTVRIRKYIGNEREDIYHQQTEKAL